MKKNLIIILIFLGFHILYFDTEACKLFNTTYRLLNPFKIGVSTINIMQVLIHIIFCSLLIIVIQKEIDDIFHVYEYIKVRLNRNINAKVILNKVYKKIILVYLIHIIIFFLISISMILFNINFSFDARNVIILHVSFFITLFIWADIFWILKLVLRKSKYCYFILLTLIVLSYFIRDIHFIFLIFTVSDWRMLDNPLCIFMMKLIFSLALYIIKFKFFKKKEFLGVVDYD